MKKYYFIYLSIIATTYSMEDGNNNNTQNTYTTPIDYKFHICFTKELDPIANQETIKCKISINPLFFKQRIDALKSVLLASNKTCDALFMGEIKNYEDQSCFNNPFQEIIEKTCTNLNEEINDIKNPIDFAETIKTIKNLSRSVKDNLRSNRLLPLTEYNQQRIYRAITIHAFLDCIIKINHDPYLGVSSICYGSHLMAQAGIHSFLNIFYKVSGIMPLDSYKQSAQYYVDPKKHPKTYYFLATISDTKLPESLQKMSIKNLNGQPQESLGQLPQSWLANTPTQAEE